MTELDAANLGSEPSSTQLPFTFTAYFQGEMGMAAPPEQVATYLNTHEHWFRRCAEPMAAEPMGSDGYVITVGQFSSFGYEVEPKMAVILDPPRDGIYHMYSVDVPDYEPPGYQIDYNAALTMMEQDPATVDWLGKNRAIATPVTLVQWYLNLHITLRFPRFIYRLPHDFLQRTGDNSLAQIIRQVSPRLTRKVQKDFHQQHDLPLPPKASRQLVRVMEPTSFEA